ncbi:MAG: hypothetical protein WBQ20_05470, partial [Methyloceanibacter sp.]
QYTVRTNATPGSIAELNDIPIKYTNGATVFIKDIGQVRDGSAVQHTGRRRGGSRWLGFGALLALIGALAYGGWRYETQQLETAATSKQRADFVPSLRVATVKASDSTTLVTFCLPRPWHSLRRICSRALAAISTSATWTSVTMSRRGSF